MSKKNKARAIVMPLLISVVIVTSYMTGKISGNASGVKNFITESGEMISPSVVSSKLGQILYLLNSNYVEAINVDTLTEEYILPILHKLDPHSDYIPAKDAAESSERLDGEFEGIGIMFNMSTDTIIIQSVISGGPSEKVGIVSGDRIIKINDSIVAGREIANTDIIKQLKGARGSSVKVSVERFGADNLIDFDIIRDKIPIKSIDAAYMVTPEVGYIKLLQFSLTTHEEFVKAVEELKEQGMTKLIFDLTNNGGGHLFQAILIANEFLPENKLIVYTEGLHAQRSDQYSDGTGRFQDQELVVLINENSASASEIVSGALQDNDRGTIVGRRSFGKGLVQRQIPFSDGSLINITIARYHTPTGRFIQRPYDQGYEQYYIDFYKRYTKDGELVSHPDTLAFPDSLKYTTPGGKVVYGGGGIMPDIFVPTDTLLFSKEVRGLLSNNTLFTAALRYTDKYRSEITSITSIEELDSYFEERKELLFNAVTTANKKPIYLNAKDKELVLDLLKSYISRNSSQSDNGFYYFFNRHDEIFQKGVEVISEEQP